MLHSSTQGQHQVDDIQQYDETAWYNTHQAYAECYTKLLHLTAECHSHDHV